MAVQRYKFKNSKQLDALPLGKHADGAGLYLYKGKKYSNWVFRFTWAGKRKEMGLGGYPSIGLREARLIMSQHEKALIEGKNPIEQREALTASQKQEILESDPGHLKAQRLDNMALAAFEARKHQLRGEGKAGGWFSPLELHVLPSLGSKRISEIDGKAIAATLAPIWHIKQDTARKALGRLRICLKHGRSLGYKIDRDAVDDAKTLLGQQTDKPKHIPSMDYKDVPAFYASLGNSAGDMALKLLILTASRSKPIRLAHMDQIEEGLWTIEGETMKGVKGKTPDFTIPLSSHALGLIEQATPYKGLLFPSPVKRGPLSDMAMAAIMKKRGLEERPHGFRSSFRMWADEQTEASFEVKEMCLAHKVGSAVSRAYSRGLMDEKRRRLFQAWGDYVTSQTGEKKAGVPHLNIVGN